MKECAALVTMIKKPIRRVDVGGGAAVLRKKEAGEGPHWMRLVFSFARCGN